MRKYLSFTLLLVALLLLSGCQAILPGSELHGKGSVVTRDYPLAAGSYSLVVTDIQLDDPLAGIITIDEDLADVVTLATQENIADTITIAIDESAGKIRVKGDKKYRYKTDSFTITIGVPVVDARVDNAFVLDAKLPSVTDFALKINGAVSGDFAFGLLDRLDFQIDGAGSLRFSGQCDDCTATLNGASDVDGASLTTRRAKITINGTGDYIVNATDTLEATINGAGSITYLGNPAVTQSINGLGEIKPK